MPKEIKVTPEMFAAGRDVLTGGLPVPLRGWPRSRSPSETAEAVYRAMESVRRSQLKREITAAECADIETLGGVWQIYFSKADGRALGPAIPFGTPSRLGWARIIDDKWVERACDAGAHRSACS